ncbi:MAG: PqqD family peptide modification chaperone [Chloroflexi bacterium]|nr:PqqD family peptide modification chaperone [Chloroflexota bacterium]
MSSEAIKYLKNPDVVCREELQEEWLFFNPETNQKRVSNVLGAYVWELCDGTRDLAGIVAAVCAEFEGAPEDAVVEDIRALLDEMTAEGFLNIQ